MRYYSVRLAYSVYHLFALLSTIFVFFFVIFCLRFLHMLCPACLRTRIFSRPHMRRYAFAVARTRFAPATVLRPRASPTADFLQILSLGCELPPNSSYAGNPLCGTPQPTKSDFFRYTNSVVCAAGQLKILRSCVRARVRAMKISYVRGHARNKKPFAVNKHTRKNRPEKSLDFSGRRSSVLFRVFIIRVPSQFFNESGEENVVPAWSSGNIMPAGITGSIMG